MSLVLGACGIKDDASVAAGGLDFCEEARALSEVGPELPESAEAIEQLADRFGRLAAAAPPEIEEDMEFLADVYRQVTDALRQGGGDDPADLFAAAAPFFDPENAQRLQEANANVERYLADECDIDVSTSTTAAEETTTSTTEAEETTTTEGEETTTTEAEETTTSTTTGEGGALPPGEPPGDLGDDPALDALADQCFEGDMEACDALFFQSPIDSAYEDYGDTCGGRNQPMGLCTDLYPGN